MIIPFFTHNQKTYFAGTLLVIKMSYIKGITRQEVVEFVGYNKETKRYLLRLNNHIYEYTEEIFRDKLIGIEGMKSMYILKRSRKATFKEEMGIDQLFLGWVWYICIMAIALIFNCRVLIWFWATAFFFTYRKQKLKEAGYR